MSDDDRPLAFGGGDWNDGDQPKGNASMDKVSGGTPHESLNLESEIRELREKAKQAEEEKRAAGERRLMFGIFETPAGPMVDCKIDLRMALRLLSSACDDLREQIAVQRLAAAMAQRPVEVPRVQIIGANGAPAGIKR